MKFSTFVSLLIFWSSFRSSVSETNNIGKCNLSSPPKTWLSTDARGIVNWATGGQNHNGNSFCIQGDYEAQTVQVAFHIDLPSRVNFLSSSSYSHFSEQLLGEKTNYCVNKDVRIRYCMPVCLDQKLQNMVIESAMKSNQASVVAKDIEQYSDWAIAVLQVDFNNPDTHLNVSQMMNADAWCSVYVGIKPKLGFSYLYEIQLGKVFKD